MMDVLYYEQGSAEWYQARLGLPTASEFSTLLAKGKDGGASLTRKTYMHKLAGEILTGEPAENYSNPHMERGKALEEEARNLYALISGTEPQQVGFIRSGQSGCSPDSLIAPDGALEIKTTAAHLLIEEARAGRFTSQHKPQCQGVLWIAEREWIDLALYWPKLPLVTRRAHRDEPYIKTLSAAVDTFNAELWDLVHWMQGYAGDAPALGAALTASLEAST